MVDYKVSHRYMDKIWKRLLKFEVLLCLLWFPLILTPGRAQDDFLNYRAVFNNNYNSCNEIWTLSPNISIPALKNFTICVYLKLYNPQNSWTAFVYNKSPAGNFSASGRPMYELGLTGKRDKLSAWIFGRPITWTDKLENNTWYQICIQWKSEQQEVNIYVNNEEKRSETITKRGQLAANGQLLLGCSEFPNSSSFTSDGMVGELYMFRMWENVDINQTQDCQDGTTILWRKNNWVYNETAQCSSSLPCANTVDMLSNHQNISVSTTADSSIVTFVTYPNSATELSSAATLYTTETTNIIEIISSTTEAGERYTNMGDIIANVTGTNFLYNNICNLSVLCNDSVFYTGSVKFQIGENTSDTYRLTVKYPGNKPNQYQLNVHSTPLPELNISDFNKTLQKLSQSSLMECSEINQSVSNCNFIIKLEGKMNISNLLSDLQERTEISPIEACCCSAIQALSCPTAKDLQLMQCEVHEPTACMDSSISPVVPYTIPLTEQNTVVPSVPHTESFIPTTSSETMNPDFTVSTKQTVPFSEMYPTSVSPFQPPSVSQAILSTHCSKNSTNNVGDPSGISTEQINYNQSGITNSTYAYNIENIVSELEGHLSTRLIVPTLAQSMLEKVTLLLNEPQSQIHPLSRRIIKIVDTIGLKLNFSTDSINFTTSSLALSVLKVNSSSFSKVSFAVDYASDLQVTLGTQVPSKIIGVITLPSSIIADLSPEDKHTASRITFNFFERTTLFQDSTVKNLSLISHIISSSVANLSVSNLKTNVTLALQNTRPNQENLPVLCAFWDFSKNGGQGGWNTEGCVVKKRTRNQTVCSCNHLTSFGILLDLSRNTTIPPIQVLILTFITYIGCGLSAIFLSVTLVTYIAFEKLRRDYPSKILIQLCVALLLLNLVFLMDSWVALYDIQGLCISVAAFLHYFLLVSFTWMGLEAFHMYLALVKVFNTYVRKYILKFCIIGWGLPAAVITIVLAVSPHNYGLGSYGKFPHGASDEFCWIKSDLVFYITVVGYFCTIFLLNISMFIVVLIQLCRIKKKKQLGTQRKTSIQDLRSVAGLTFLLGITWGFAFFAWGPVNLVFMYLFAIFNTLQGFFIFMFYCVAKENVRKQWRRYLCCGKYRLAENSDWNRTAMNGLRKQNVNQGVSSSSHSLQSNSNSTNSTSMLMSNDYSIHTNGNISNKKNGVSFNTQNGNVQLPDVSIKQHVFHENSNIDHKKSCISLRRTSKRKTLQFIEPI